MSSLTRGRAFLYGSNASTECWLYAGAGLFWFMKRSCALRAWLDEPEAPAVVASHVHLGVPDFDPVATVVTMFNQWDKGMHIKGMNYLIPGGYQDPCDHIVFPILSAISSEVESHVDPSEHPLAAISWHHETTRSVLTFALPSELEHLKPVLDDERARDSGQRRQLVLIGARCALTPGHINVAGIGMRRACAVVFTYTPLGSPHYVLATVRHADVGDPDYMYTFDSLSDKPSVPTLRHIPTLGDTESFMCAVLYVEECDDQPNSAPTESLHQMAEQPLPRPTRPSSERRSRGGREQKQEVVSEVDPV